MSSYKIGDKVRCVPGGAKGAGYETNLIFVIKKITNDFAEPIYWPGRGTNGVFESSLELVDQEWDQ